jgi:diamine N-acetyltransferase
MTVSLAPITVENWVECIHLSPTAEQAERRFCAPNVLSLAQAYAERWWRPYAIYAGDTMVGFILHARWPEVGLQGGHGPQEPGIDYILRFMIDQAHQGKGYGKSALQLLIEQVAADPESRAIELDYDRDNRAAMNLFTSLGFRPYREEDGEIYARLELDERLLMHGQ